MRGAWHSFAFALIMISAVIAIVIGAYGLKVLVYRKALGVDVAEAKIEALQHSVDALTAEVKALRADLEKTVGNAQAAAGRVPALVEAWKR